MAGDQGKESRIGIFYYSSLIYGPFGDGQVLGKVDES